MISVIIPVYNVEDYIKICINSLKNQNISKQYEMLLIDDGSTDRSSAICDELAKEDDRIFVFHKNNGGLSDARNYGLKYARGEWITFVDSDDYVSDSYLSDLYNLVKKFNSDLAITKVILRNAGQEFDSQNDFEDFSVGKKDALYEVYGGNKIGWSACGKLFRKSILGTTPFPKGYYEDSGSMYRIIDKCENIAIGDYKNNYFYIRREGSITYSELQEKHFRIFDICDEFNVYIKNNYPDLEYMSILLYQNSVEQLLNRLIMTDKQFEKIFFKYQILFRDNISMILFNKKIDIKNKVYYFILCTNPFFYKKFQAIAYRKRRK